MESKPAWTNSANTMAIVFNVRRGLCVFVRTGLNQGILYDCGRSDDFDPLEFILRNLLPHMDAYYDGKTSHPLAQRVLSHPHTDHIAGIEHFWREGKARPEFSAGLHTCPHHKTEGAAKPEALDWSRVNNQKADANLEEIYKGIYEKRPLPLQTIQYKSGKTVTNLDYGIYYVRPPVVAQVFEKSDQEYVNGMSIVLYLRHGRHVLLVPGDINAECMKHILEEGVGLEKRFTRFQPGTTYAHPEWYLKTTKQPSLKTLLGIEKRHCLLVASHHGLESGYSQELYDAMWQKKPGLVAISDSRRISETGGKTHPKYEGKDGSVGQQVFVEGRPEFRNSVSTKNGHHILVVLGQDGQDVPRVYLEKDPRLLIGRMSENI